MNQQDVISQSQDYRRVELAIEYIEANLKSQPSLDRIADAVHLSPFHFNRLFKRWAGITPGQFLHFLTLEYAKEQLAAAQNLLDASLEAGLSGPSRLHDLFVTFEAMTPGEFKRLGQGLTLDYGFHETPFGECLMAVTHRGICHLSFVEGPDRAEALSGMQDHWPESRLMENPNRTSQLVSKIFSLQNHHDSRPFHLLLKGTNFQVNVWRALLAIPSGRMVSYENLAAHIGRPKAFRAVANAVAANPLAYLIPCHRVIAKSGRIHKYRWGPTRKKAILGWEAAAVTA